MKSVGEAMAIGRTFKESLQKALCALEIGLSGFDEIEIPGADGPYGKGHRESARSRRRPLIGCGSPPRRCAMASATTRSTRSPSTTPGSSLGIREIVDEEVAPA